MRTRFPIACAGALAMLAACAPEPEQNPASNIVEENGTAAVAVVPAGNRAVNMATADPAGPAVNLAPDELTLVLPSGSARHLAFAMPKAAVIQTLTAALGSPIEQVASQDCDAGTLGHAAFRDGLSVYFQDDKFVGWDVDGENAPYSTANGIRIGSTRTALEEAGSGPLSVEESTIGLEFSLGALSGLLSAPGGEGKVTNLWAGATCIAR